MSAVSEIRLELNRLSSAEHRSEQGIWATPKQLKNLTKLLGKAASLNRNSVSDFARCVNDIAPLTAQISKLSEQLYKEVQDG